MVSLRKVQCRLVYGIPEGTKCLVIASEGKTTIRDRSGYMLEHLNTLLPNGNPTQHGNSKTMLQGVYSNRDKTVYLTDILMWDNELMIDAMTEFRLIMLITKIKDNPLLSGSLSPDQQVLFRVPQILECSPQNFESMYYGPGKSSVGVGPTYEQLLTYIRTHNLASLLKLEHADIKAPETMLKVSCAFAKDHMGEPYLKDGLAFVHLEGVYTLGVCNTVLQWKDAMVTPYFDSLLHTPMVACLYLDRARLLRTFDGYFVDKTDPAISTLKPNETYMFTYNNVLLNDPSISLIGLKYVQPCRKIVWSTMSQLVFCILARKNMLPYTVLLQQIQSQHNAPTQ